MKNKYVIVRGDRSGVFAGYVKERKGQEITLTKARKIFYWNGACAVEQLARDGVSKPKECKFTVVIDEICILDVIQILPATEKSRLIIEGVQEWKL